MDHVAGYTIVNDVSERDFQFHGGGGQWIKGKSPDTFAPDGPVAGDQGRDPRPAEPRTCGSRSTAAASRTARPAR